MIIVCVLWAILLTGMFISFFVDKPTVKELEAKKEYDWSASTVTYIRLPADNGVRSFSLGEKSRKPLEEEVVLRKDAHKW